MKPHEFKEFIDHRVSQTILEVRQLDLDEELDLDEWLDTLDLLLYAEETNSNKPDRCGRRGNPRIAEPPA